MLLAVALALITTATAKNVFVSSPFDNFRIECPKRAAATELSVRMVESVGQKRQDVVFDLSCETIEQLYPWVNIPVGISEIEREDCRYSEMIDPILDDNTTYSCASREYMAGITRLSDTRIQVMCCRLRSRDEFNCGETTFNKPIGLTRSTVIEHDGQLINAIRVHLRQYVVRFCDLAPRSIPDIFSDEKIKSTTRAPTTVDQSANVSRQKHDPMKIEKSQKAEIPVVQQQKPEEDFVLQASTEGPTEPPVVRAPKKRVRVETVKTESAEVPTLPLLEISDAVHRDAVTAPENVHLEQTLPQPPPRQFTRHRQIPKAVPVSLPAAAPEPREPMVSQEAILKPEPPVHQQPQLVSGQLVDDIIRKIASAQSEQKAALIFQQSVNELLQSANEKPIEKPTTNEPEIVTDGPPAATPPSEMDLSKITFSNDDFPKPNAQPSGGAFRPRYLKELLPLRRDLRGEKFSPLQMINADGHRRSPIRTHRPHVDIWSSEEEEEEEMSQVNESAERSVEAETTTTARPRRIVKKIIKKVIRAHRSTVTSTTTTTAAPPTTKHLSSEFFTSIEDELSRENLEDHFTKHSRRFGMTTTPSARRDLPARRKAAENRVDQHDNAREVDEETLISPFEDLPPTETTTHRPSISHAKSKNRPLPKVDFQEDEDIEEVISKLSVRKPEIRRAPIRNSVAEAQFGEKEERNQIENDRTMERVQLDKDGVKTHIPQNEEPILMTTLKISKNLDPEESNSEDDDRKVDLQDIGLVPMDSPKSEESEKNELITEETTRPPATTTTVYDPSNFYRTPRPKPAKKEKILRFCSKELALRDQSNMVIACGLDADVWVPSRCPQNADCFPSHDSLYRICCPVHHG
ncbi:unnamed protein product [Caenorhabditis auriculariae]|uniref:Uncharacterized protein n=1 Tax=Caenorhabditis auriculariae TaxID=2777116 RepID=A0A8S1HBI1_9PELO|nr:unnamed protein product [Caenorhabditis auriculariae]